MKALLLSALLVAGLLTEATAQQAVGPVAITNTVNGIPVTVSATSWVTTNPVGNELRVHARIFVDLIDLQKKFASVVGSFKLPANRCSNRGHGNNQNPFVSFRGGSLWPVDDRLVMSVRGDVDVWSCIAGPQKSAIEWRKKKIWFLKVNLPERHTWRTMKERKDGVQSFSGSMPIQLVKKDDASVSLKIADSDIKLEGQEGSTIASNPSLAKHINQKAYNALQSAIDPAKLKMALPKELQKLNMTVVSTRFRSYGGHAIAEINLAAAGAPYTQ